jgi:hypothetical protein
MDIKYDYVSIISRGLCDKFSNPVDHVNEDPVKLESRIRCALDRARLPSDSGPSPCRFHNGPEGTQDVSVSAGIGLAVGNGETFVRDGRDDGANSSAIPLAAM